MTVNSLPYLRRIISFFETDESVNNRFITGPLHLVFSRVSELLDYTADELTGKNLYTLCHGEDANRLRKSHIDRKYD